MMDDWSLNLRRHYAAGYPANAKTIQHDILHSAAMIEEETVNEERSFSMIRRFVSLLVGSQGWATAAKEVNNRWIGHLYRKAASVMRPRPDRAESATVQTDGRRATPAIPIRKRAQKPFNRFLEEQQGNPAAANLAAQWEKFKALTEDELKELDKRKRPRDGGDVVVDEQPCKKARFIQREDARRRATEFGHLHRLPRITDDHGNALGENGEYDQILTDDAISVQLPKLTELSHMKHRLRMDAQSDRTTRESEEAQVQEFMDSNEGGGQLLADVATALPTLSEQLPSLAPITPSVPTHKVLEWAPVQTAGLVKTLASKCHMRTGHGKALAKLTEQLCTSFNATVLHRVIPEVANNKAVRRYCQERHVCVCSAAGKRLAQFVNKVFATLKRVILSVSGADEQASQAYYGFMFIAEDTKRSKGRPRNPCAGAKNLPKPLFMHLGHFDKKPQALYLQRMEATRPVNCSWDDDMILRRADQKLSLQATVDKGNGWQMLQRVDLSRTIHLAFYKLDDSHSILPRIRPDIQSASFQHSGSLFTVWSQTDTLRSSSME